MVIQSRAEPDGQFELPLRPLPEMQVALGGASERFMQWAADWALHQVRTMGSVWTDDLHEAAVLAHAEPPDDSLYGRFWACRARQLGLRRTVDERVSRNRLRNGAKARRWILGEPAPAQAPTHG